MAPTVRLMIVEPREVVRIGLHRIIYRDPRIALVGEASDVSDAGVCARVSTPSVVMVDVTKPYERVLEFVREVQDISGARCLAFTDDLDWNTIRLWIDAGGSGYLSKSAPPAEILEGILKVAAGKVYISPSISIPANEPRKQEDRLLSDREQEVARLVAIGHTSGEISEKLFISKRTVENHRLRISRKLGLRSRYQLLEYVVEAGLLDSLPDTEDDDVSVDL